jgi:hypothetical protein
MLRNHVYNTVFSYEWCGRTYPRLYYYIKILDKKQLNVYKLKEQKDIKIIPSTTSFKFYIALTHYTAIRKYLVTRDIVILYYAIVFNVSRVAQSV